MFIVTHIFHINQRLLLPVHISDKGAVAGFLPTTESNLRTAMVGSLAVEICKSFYYRPHLQTACKDVYRSVQQDVLGICSDQKRDKNCL